MIPKVVTPCVDGQSSELARLHGMILGSEPSPDQHWLIMIWHRCIFVGTWPRVWNRRVSLSNWLAKGAFFVLWRPRTAGRE